MYKCIKGFSLEKCDDDGFTIEGEYETVEEGSIWNIPKDEGYRFIGGEIRLESDNLSWIEIAKEHLEKCFEEVISKEYIAESKEILEEIEQMQKDL